MIHPPALPASRSRTGAVSRLVLSLVCIAGLGGTVLAQQNSPQETWNASDIRKLMRDYMQANGKPAPKDKDIWPLDDQLRLTACAEHPEIAPRSARSSSYTIRCKGPTAWTYTVSVENDSAGPARAMTVSTPQGQPAVAPSPAAVMQTAGLNNNSMIVRDMFTAIVPRVDLTAGTILSADMLEERQMPQSPGATAFKTVQEAVGLRLTTSVGPTSILNTRNVAKAPSVLKGETVTLKAGGSNFEIFMPGRAEADGYEGDLISVRNIKTGAKLVGKLGPGGIVQLK